jgi:hypothetical protein
MDATIAEEGSMERIERRKHPKVRPTIIC